MPPVPPPHAPDFTSGSVLLSLWFLLALAAVTAGFVTIVVCMFLRPVRGRLRLAGRAGWAFGVGAAVLSLLFGAATVADGINRHFAYFPSFSALRGDYSRDLVGHKQVLQVALRAASGRGLPTHGIVEDVVVRGPKSRIARHGFVYLPRAYFDPAQQKRRFPVLYLLHGSPGVAPDWLRGGFVDRAMDDLIGRHAIKPFIIVLPDVNGGYHRDTECQDIAGGPQIQTYLTNDVTGWVDSHYRTITNPDGRAIGGLSSGGYCALNLMLRHQDVFSAAVMHSGSLTPIEGRYSGSLWRGNSESRRANTPRDYISTIPIGRPLGVYCDGGADDHDSVQTCIDARRLLDERHVPVEIHILRHEGHSFSAWRKNLYLSLPWVSQWFADHATGQTVASNTATG